MKPLREILEGKLLDKDEGLVHEPTHSQLAGIVHNSRYKEARLVHHPKHGLFAWPAEKKTHNDMVNHINNKHGHDIDIDHTTRLFAQKHKDGKGLITHQSGSENHGKDDDPRVNHPTINKTHRSKNLEDYESHYTELGK